MIDPAPETDAPPAPKRRLARVRPWIIRVVLASLLGVGAAVLAMRTPWESFGIALPREIMAVVAGWLILSAALPWKRMLLLSHVQNDLEAFTQTVRRLSPTDRQMSIRILPTDRDDELGDVARAVHDVLAEAIACRIEVKSIQRTMDDNIRRETQKATAHLQREVVTDPLTGLGNRRGLDQYWERFVDVSGRATRTGCVIAIDLDGFKPINDTLGHDVGDDVLRFLGNIIQSSLRQNDLAVRLGGDEFLIVLPDSQEHEAASAAKRLEALFRQMPWPHRKVGRPTFSYGLATFRRGDVLSEDAVLKAADTAMYRRKEGRRRDSDSAAA